MAMDSYIAAAAKTRALFGGILNENVYDDLLSRNSVADVAVYLRNHTVYGEVLESLPLAELHRADLEILLKRQFIIETGRIYKHIKDKYFFFDLNLDFEIEILKTIIRSFLTEGSCSHNYDLLIFKKGQFFDFADLISAESLNVLITKLKKSKVSKYVVPILSEKDPKLIQSIETNLDIFYFTNAYLSAKNNLKGEQLEFVNNFLGTKADLYNVVLILRAKKYFSWARDEIIPHIINYYNRINSEVIYKMADAPSFAACEAFLSKTVYGHIAEDSGFDILMKKYYLSKYISRIRASVDFKAVLYYFQLKKIDIENIITITEAVRYGYGRAEAKKMIVYK
jgi:V/A-type H+-transporting ATPase subunit C